MNILFVVGGNRLINNSILERDFYWLNEPKHIYKDESLIITSDPDTDFWQNTHYGFNRDNGHCLLKAVQNDFSLSVRTKFNPKMQYDQCGLIVRADSNNWIKCSIEFENETHSRLGSVVTNLGYSDWATIDLHSSPKEMWYRIQSKKRDFLIEYSENGKDWKQMRITHLLADSKDISIGIYCCSPMESSFEAMFDNLVIEQSKWK